MVTYGIDTHMLYAAAHRGHNNYNAGDLYSGGALVGDLVINGRID